MIEAHGRDAVALYAGNPTVHSLSATVMVPVLVRALGVRELLLRRDHRSDAKARFVRVDVRVSDDDTRSRHRSDRLPPCPRRQPWVSNGSLATAPDFRGRLEAIRPAGGKVVVVDPRRTETAAGADEHVFIRPGTDAFFLLAMA